MANNDGLFDKPSNSDSQANKRVNIGLQFDRQTDNSHIVDEHNNIQQVEPPPPWFVQEQQMKPGVTFYQPCENFPAQLGNAPHELSAVARSSKEANKGRPKIKKSLR